VGVVEVEGAGAPLGAGVDRGGRGFMQGTEAGSMQDAGRCIGYAMASESCSRADLKWGWAMIAGKWERGWLRGCEGLRGLLSE
jgi:hypothetical protein